ncbi:MAG TPA: tetratricopeptide repeat protein, partial [Haliangium sp.]|nr:tetratricopeptide repeat protein [Haliangium sp.]
MRPLLSSLSIVALLAASLVALPARPAQAQRSERQRRDQKKAARSHYERGRAHHERNEYEQAIREYQLAYDLQPSAALLFNIAQVYLLAGDREKALENYRAYLREEPEGDVAELARQRIEAIEGELAAENLETPPITERQGQDATQDGIQDPDRAAAAPAPAEPQADSAPASSPGQGMRWAGLAVAGVGLVGVGLGVKFGLDASDVQDRIESQPEGTPWTFDDLYAEGEAASRNMWISYGVGSAALIAGGALYYLGRSAGSAGERQLAIVPV